jgi:hypothetical protein
MSVAAYLKNEGAPLYQHHLKSFGTPTVFRCDVPLHLLPEIERYYLGQNLFYACRRRRREPKRVGMIDHTVGGRPALVNCESLSPQTNDRLPRGWCWYYWPES